MKLKVLLSIWIEKLEAGIERNKRKVMAFYKRWDSVITLGEGEKVMW